MVWSAGGRVGAQIGGGEARDKRREGGRRRRNAHIIFLHIICARVRMHVCVGGFGGTSCTPSTPHKQFFASHYPQCPPFAPWIPPPTPHPHYL